MRPVAARGAKQRTANRAEQVSRRWHVRVRAGVRPAVRCGRALMAN
jgi:hypothetical protein